MALVSLLVILCVGAELWAQPAEEDLSVEIQTLERQIEAEVLALTTGNCAVACLALESMIRATDRLCELAPGPSCSAARDKVAAAKERVRSTCPDCAATMAQQPVEPIQPTPPPPADQLDEETATPAAGPPPEDARGGCAACTIQEHHETPAPWLAALFALTVTVFRRRRR
ncbi:MAG: hypothetical protein DRI90_13120 [Deltaproteobacteria bacterium]|nr:MAG: hypothetical protein DRI90_13120 [Deltaproteobacteria bacterium]